MLGNIVSVAAALALVAVSPAWASFDLITPQSLAGSDLERASEWPCGGQDLQQRTYEYQWPLSDNGVDITWDSPDSNAGWLLTALLPNATAEPGNEDGTRILDLLYTTKPGRYTARGIRGVPEWVGLDVILQVRQWVDIDYLYSVSFLFPGQSERGGFGC